MKKIESPEIPFINVIDIGASGGIDKRWANLKTRGVLVEPDPREIENLKKSLPANYSLITTALSDTKGKKNFFLYRKQQSSSFNPPNLEFTRRFPDYERLEVVSQIQMETDTLDNQLEMLKIDLPDVIKVDVEGHELPILQGSLNAIENLIALETEVNFADVRTGVPAFGDIDVFLRGKGLTLIDVRKTYWLRRNVETNYSHKGQIILGDALYFLLPDRVLQKFKSNSEKCFKAFLIYLAYGYYDLGLEIYQLCANRNWDAELTKVADTYLANARPRKVPLFLARVIRKISTNMAALGGNISWFSGDDKLGN